MPPWQSRARVRAKHNGGGRLAQSREALLEACAGGDRVALQSLYTMTAPQLFGLALGILRSRDLAEDIVQDSFVLIWRHARSFDPDRGTAMAWLGRIVRNQCLDALRLRGCLEQLEDSPRQSLLLAYYHGLTFEEVAGRVKAPLGTVKSWIRRSLIRLKGCMDR